MTDLRKFAWYQLVIIAVGCCAFVAMFALTGNVLGSFAAFSVLGLLAIPHIRAVSNRKRLVRDERDEAIWQKAESAGYATGWVFLIIWGVWVGTTFPVHEGVPYVFVAPVVWIAWLLMMAARAVATLVLDGQGR